MKLSLNDLLRQMSFASNLHRSEDCGKRGRGARVEDGGGAVVGVLHAAPLPSTGSVLQCSRQM